MGCICSWNEEDGEFMQNFGEENLLENIHLQDR
jgi:hypothetical protein